MKRYATIALLCIPLALSMALAPAWASAEGILGKWSAKAVTPNGPLDLELEIKMEGSQLVGTLTGFQGVIPLSNLKFVDPDLSLEVTLMGATFKLTGVLKEGKFEGKYEQVGTDFQGPWTAERKLTSVPAELARGISGAWDSVAVTSNGELALALDVKQDGDKLTGTLGSEMGTIPIQAATFNDNKLQFDVEIGGNTYRVRAELKEEKFAGQWSAVGGTDFGEWRAARKAAVPPTAAAAAPSPAAVLGSWDSVAVTPNGDMQAVLELKQEGDKLAGTIGSDMGSLPIQAASFKDSRLQFDLEFGGGTYRIQADLKEDKLAGRWSAVGATDSGPWSASRKPASSAGAAASVPLDGHWNSVAVTPDGNSLTFQLELKQAGSSISGNAVSPDGNIPLQKATFNDNVLIFELEYLGSAYRIQATLENGKFTGKWSAVSGPESGAWSAERQTGR